MRRLIFQNGALITASLVLAVAAGCGKKDMEARKGPAAGSGPGSPTVTESDVIENPMGAPGFTGFELTPVKDEQVLNELYSLLSPNLTEDIWNKCSHRAHIWAYQMYNFRQIESGKVFLFYTVSPSGPGRRLRFNAKNPAGKEWVWHAAPYVGMADGSLYAMENFAGVRKPMPLREWLGFQTLGSACVELKDADKPLLKNICGEVSTEVVNGIEKKKCTRAGRINAIEVPQGGPKCYFRRMPSYYAFPYDVADHDYLGVPAKTEWNLNSVLSICNVVMAGTPEEKATRCMDLVNGVEAFARTSLPAVFDRIDAGEVKTQAAESAPGQYLPAL